MYFLAQHQAVSVRLLAVFEMLSWEQKVVLLSHLANSYNKVTGVKGAVS